MKKFEETGSANKDFQFLANWKCPVALAPNITRGKQFFAIPPSALQHDAATQLDILRSTVSRIMHDELQLKAYII